MNDRPTAIELLGAVEEFLRKDAIPNLSGVRRFHARVAANVVAMVAREIDGDDERLRGEVLRLGALLGEPGEPSGSLDSLREEIRRRNQELAARIRRGDADAGEWRAEVLAHLRRTVGDKLAVATGRPLPRKAGLRSAR